MKLITSCRRLETVSIKPFASFLQLFHPQPPSSLPNTTGFHMLGPKNECAVLKFDLWVYSEEAKM